MTRILAVGGGSGGHVTPVVAVLQELRSIESNVELKFWCDGRFAQQAQHIIYKSMPDIKVERVLSGKLRRYNNLSKIQHITSPSVLFPNLRDAVLVILGIFQSIVRLLLWRPNVVFAKGGYVCLPVGIAAWLLKIPLVIHDSDATPGLTNRLLAPLATFIATGMPLKHYSYPEKKSFYLGIPIDSSYKKPTPDEQRALKIQFGFDADKTLTVISGGGQGAKSINNAVAKQLNQLLVLTNVLLISGPKQYDELRSLIPLDDKRCVLKDFLPGMADAFRAADIVISRAGATALLELAALGIPTIVIPNNSLKWQVEHAKLFFDAEAVLPLDEDLFIDPDDQSIVNAVQRITTDVHYRQGLGKKLELFAKPTAAKDLSKLILRAAHKLR